MDFTTDGSAVGAGGGGGGTTVIAFNFGAAGTTDYPTRGDIEYDSAKGFGFHTSSPGSSYRQSFTRGVEAEPLDSVTRAESYYDSTLAAWQALPSTYEINSTAGLSPSTSYIVEVQLGDSATSKSQKVTANGTTIFDGTAGGGGGNHQTASATVTSDASGIITLDFGTPGTHVTALNTLKISTP